MHRDWYRPLASPLPLSLPSQFPFFQLLRPLSLPFLEPPCSVPTSRPAAGRRPPRSYSPVNFELKTGPGPWKEAAVAVFPSYVHASMARILYASSGEQDECPIPCTFGLPPLDRSFYGNSSCPFLLFPFWQAGCRAILRGCGCQDFARPTTGRRRPEVAIGDLYQLWEWNVNRRYGKVGGRRKRSKRIIS